MSKYDKISNYNVNNENFNQVVKEFEGYLLGMTRNDFLLFVNDLDPNLKNEYLATLANDSLTKSEEELFRKNIVPKIFDRSTGAYFLNDYTKSSSLKNSTGIIDIGKFLNMIVHQRNFQALTGAEGFQGSLIQHVGDQGGSTEYSISQSLPYVNITNIIRKEKQDDNGKPVKDANGEVVKEISNGVPGELSYEGNHLNQELIPDRFKSPSLVAQVVRIPGVGITGRQKTHLPIFFNAIPTIEMSRCTPYIDIKIITTDFGQINRLNNVSFMRFVRNDAGEFVSDDGIGLFNKTSDIINNVTNGSSKNQNVSTMDLFTSPQTMANANINRSSPDLSFKSVFTSNGNLNNPIYEPIAPFASLKSFSVSITSAGAGLLASKSGQLSMVIHDRSRLKDLAPLLATDRFATTKIQVEFGWNHPDGTPGGENLIGQYLDGLKDVHIYQVLGTDYSFGSGGSVDLNVKLVAYGFKENKRVHIGAGPYVPLNSISDIIESAITQVKKETKDLPPEIRQKVKVNARSARQLSAIITWDEWKLLSSYMGPDKSPDLLLSLVAHTFKASAIFNYLEDANEEQQQNLLNNEAVSNTLSQTFEEASVALLNATNKDINKETLIAAVLGKLEGLKGDKSDPFIFSLHKDANPDFYNLLSFEDGNRIATNARYDWLLNSQKDLSNNEEIEYVTLGKLLLTYIGWSLAATCVYDEVQLIFYPLNHHAGRARGHTTASFPVPIHRVEKMLIDQLNRNTNVTVDSFLRILEREIIRDRSLPVYGLSNIDSIKELDSTRDFKTSDQKYFAMLSILKSNSGQGLNNSDVDNKIKELITPDTFPSTDAERKQAFEQIPDDVKKRVREMYSEHITNLSNQVKSDITNACETYYTKDGLEKAEPKFIAPNLGLLFESVPAIDAQESGDAGFFGNVWSNLSEGITIPGQKTSNGLTNKTILKIHVYDEEAVSSPAEATLMSALSEGVSGDLLVGKDDNENIKKVIDNLSFHDAKEYIKRTMPTIIFGSHNSTIKSMSVSANTSGDLANVLMVESYGNIQSGQVDGQNYDSSFEEVTVFPNTVSVNMMGMPLITRGTTLFVDFGTNTSLDNIYTVKGVNHMITNGEFSTDLQLVPSQMGSITSFRDKIYKAVGVKETG